MCTVSWRWEDEELSIYFSRDERRTRLPGYSPEIFESAGHRFICPIDQDRGGTWFAANDTGLAVALLNDYRGKASADARTSRGHLVKELIANADPTNIEEKLHSAVAANLYPPFTLLAWHGKEAKMWGYTDTRLVFHPGMSPPVTSSSWETERVEKFRRELFQEKVSFGDWSLDQFHRYEIPNDEASSVCMTRPETRTVSLTSCRISQTEVVMKYFPRLENGEFGGGDSVSMAINLLL